MVFVGMKATHAKTLQSTPATLDLSNPLSSYIQNYLQHLAVRNFSPQTILSQSKQLRLFPAFTSLGSGLGEGWHRYW